ESMSPSDPRQDDIAQVLKASEKASSLTRQLLAFSRRQVVEPRSIVLQNVVQDVEKMLRRLIGEDIEVVTGRPDHPVRLLIDPGQLEQVILNLAINARDAMPHGGKLTIECRSMKVNEKPASLDHTVDP